MRFWKPILTAFIFATLLTACSAPPDDSASSNSNGSQQSNSNSAEQQAAQGNASTPSPGASPLTLQQLPPPAKPPKPVENSMATAKANAKSNNANSAMASTERAPKLIVPEKRLDFGKQPQDKTMIRAIPIRNGGLGVLNIDSITPS
jgi:hypothetical protein